MLISRKRWEFLGKVEFWILIFFITRLIGITNPPLETAHNWRQATGLMVARNFLEVDSRLIYPRVDDNQGSTGIIAMEFPIINYLHFLIAKVFGYTHWYGRLINLIISSIGLFFFTKIVSQFFERRVVLLSLIFLASSIWFSYSRKMMPDTFCISLMFIGLYYGIKYLEDPRSWKMMLFICFSTLSVLSKIPSAIYFILILLLIARLNYQLKVRIKLFVSLSIPIIAAYFWYYVWNPYLENTYKNMYNIGKPISIGFHEIITHADKVVESIAFNSFNSYLAFIVFAIGIFIMVMKRNQMLVVAFISLSIGFMVFIFKSGYYFYHHSYYVVPFVPMMALVAGYACSFIQKDRYLYLLLLFCVGESIANQQNDFFVKDSEKYKLKLESIANKVSKPTDLILINCNGNPQEIYLAHRKGWKCYDKDLANYSLVDSLALLGCKYLFVDKHSLKTIFGRKQVYEDGDFIVYDLSGL